MNVSVVVPTRNRSSLLATTLLSVFRQREVDLEVIVVDEASTDDTRAVLKCIADPRLHVIHHETPHGLGAARNSGAALARGDWIAFIDDDDLWAPEKLVRQIRAAEETKRDWAYAGSVNFEGCRITYGVPPPPPETVVGDLPHFYTIPGGGSNIVCRQSAWMRVGPFDTRLPLGEDWEMALRLSKDGPPGWVCSPLIAKRIHSSNLSLDVAAFVSGTKLIEQLHHTNVDWGQVHRWLASRHLTSGRWGSALGQFARAAVKGQFRGVVSDLEAIVRRRFRRPRTPEAENMISADPWKASALGWLRELEHGIH